LLLAIALWNRLYLTPRIRQGGAKSCSQMRRTIVAELILVAGILGVVALWRFTPPPRTLMVATEPFSTHLHTAGLMADIMVSPARGGLTSIAINLRTPDGRTLAARSVSVTLASPDNGIEPSTAHARSLGEGQWQVSMAAPVAGRWTLALDVLISDFDQLHAETPISID
jgi:copper transport protein